MIAHIPNKETLKAIKEVKQGKGVKFASVNDLFASIK
jgi:antitoxin component of RelBE/YafQ-DinJ toxin-antitoxin module